MNQEHEPHQHGRHRWTETDPYILPRLHHYPAELQEGIKDAADRYGLPFAAFVSVEANAFIETYVASYPSIREAIDAQIDALGWSSALKELMATEGIAEGDLVWNYTQIEAIYRAAFQVIELAGAVHVFSI
jgi:hypothetical protein